MANERPVIATGVGGVVDLLGDVVEDGAFPEFVTEVLVFLLVTLMLLRRA